MGTTTLTNKTPTIGHNGSLVDPVVIERLRGLMERIERREEDKSACSEDIKEIYKEAQSAGFDTAVMRKLITIRKQDAAKAEEMETLLDIYKRALGMLSDTPLGAAALGRAVATH